MKRFFSFFCIIALLMAMFFSNVTAAFASGSGKNVTILFTHDVHDHLLPFNLLQDGKIINSGGYARIQSIINEQRKDNPDLLLLDGGDFSMGTIFQTMFASDAPELRIMGQMGYDAVTLGNHEFDFRPDGLADSLNAAKKSGDKLPQIVASNITYPTDKNGQMTGAVANLKAAMDSYGAREYTIIERNGVRIGIFGLMGKDASEKAPMAEVQFTDIAESAKSMVDILKNKEKADLIICLSHSGTSPDKSQSEDEILAKKVPGIDVIISGHTHTKLTSPIIVGSTIIGSCGENGENLGIMNITMDDNKVWKLSNYSLKSIDSSIPEDPAISQTIDGYKKVVQNDYLDNFGLGFDQVLAETPFNFLPVADIEKEDTENTLGNLITDSYIYAVKQAEGSSYKPITAAIVPAGTIRSSFVKGKITVSDAYDVSSLGVGPDEISGYPLISVYLTGKELKEVCEVDASVAPMMPDAQLYMSGISFTFNPNRLIFNKVTDVSLMDTEGNHQKIDDNKLYRVVAGLYTAQMLSVVGPKSFGLLSIVPKDSEGKPVTDLESRIIYNDNNGKKGELKEWQALAEYLQSFDKANGIPEIPEYYNSFQGRKIVDKDGSLGAIFKSPNTIAIAAYVIVIFLLALIIFIIYRIITHRKRKQRRIAKKAKNKI